MISNICRSFLFLFKGETSAPRILVQLGGEKNSQKLLLANKAIIDWMGTMKKKSGNGKSVKCEWYQPSTQNQRLRSFFSSVTKRFDWRYGTPDFSFTGGLVGFLKTMYLKRHTEYKKVS